MESSNFITLVGEFFESWFKDIASSIRKGDLSVDGPYSFPTNLRVGESTSHFISELLGATSIDSFPNYKLKTPRKPEKSKSTSSFFNPGFGRIHRQTSTITLSNNSSLTNLTVCTEYDRKVFEDKINIPLNQSIFNSNSAELPLFIPHSLQGIVLRNVDLIRTDSFRVFYRHVSTGLVVRKSIQKKKLQKLLWSQVETHLKSYPPYIYPDLFGLNTGFDASYETFTRELLSLSDQEISEPIIDSFLQSHADKFAKALGYKRALSQINLKWIERKSCDDKVSKPDYLLEREDGYFDLLDLKKALLKYQSITRGKKSRLRFNSYVSELIAQLRGYERYFESSQNSDWAFDQYGIKLNNPLLIGIVGNYDTFSRPDVDIALEQYKDNIVVISYHDVINFIRKARSN